ncbi:MAG: acetylxylan esterase [Chthonomonadales bacterium]|nr:acetylxylan esterase [Chthonomonadales bacterium]
MSAFRVCPAAAAAICALVACLAAPAAAQRTPVTVDDLRRAFYDYDAALPLRATAKPGPTPKGESEAQRALRKRYLVAFDSAHDQRVPAIVAIPSKVRPPYPAVVLLAGSGGHKDTDYIRIASDMLCTLGIATISIDAQYHGARARKGRTGDIHFVNSVTNRDAWVQTVIDLRRAIDYLLARGDVDRERIGFLGFSQGAMIGGTLLGVEPRVAVACLAVPGAGLEEWAKHMKLPAGGDAHTMVVSAAIVDPIHFVGRFAPRPLLVLAARRDGLIPRSATEALLAAAGASTQVVWYNSGHILPPTALVTDARQFFATRLARPGRP